MTTKEKIREYLIFKGISMSKFSREIGVSNRFLASDGTIMSDKIKLIRNIFPDLNMNWLLFDEGEMIVSTETKPKKEKESTEFAQQKTLLELNLLAVNTKVEELEIRVKKFEDNLLDIVKENLEKAIKEIKK
jgi:transcriptional regulator with XRE-family HTH domain